MITLEQIQEAASRLEGVIAKVPFQIAPVLSEMVGAEVWLKKCNLQNTGAFKIRGAFNKISLLSDAERARGVIAASAGNHAQGVAWSARYYGIKAYIVMPEATPLLKVNATKAYGAEVILYGNNYDEAYGYALKYANEHDLVFVHPFADEAVIAGQGTIALEMLAKTPDLEMILVPIGGGGLISGVAVAAKSIKPDIRIVGVTAKGAPAMHDSFYAKRPIDSLGVRTIADGIAVRDTSPVTLAYLMRYVDEVVEVDDEEIANAILFLIEKQKLVIEGAGAVGVAALLHGKVKPLNGKIGVVLSGGNIDVTMLSIIIERGLVKSQRKMKLIVTLVDKPGSLMALTETLKRVNANIVHIEYDRIGRDLAYGDANVTVALETKGAEHQEEIRRALRAEKFNFTEGW
ncbi:MAG: threonine ammonia-lyase [Campylobacterales bacterium]